MAISVSGPTPISQKHEAHKQRGVDYAFLVASALQKTLGNQEEEWKSGAKERFVLQFEQIVSSELSKLDTLDEMKQLIDSLGNMQIVKSTPELQSWLSTEKTSIESCYDAKDRQHYQTNLSRYNGKGTKYTNTFIDENGAWYHTTWYTKSKCKKNVKVYREAYEEKEKVGAQHLAGDASVQSDQAKNRMSDNFEKLKSYVTELQSDATIITNLLQGGQ